MTLIRELRRRHIFRIGIAYLVVAWVVLQLVGILTPAMNLPPWISTALLYIGVLGFPLALLFAWTFVLTPEGIKRTGEVPQDESITGLTRHKLNLAIVALLTVALVLVLAERIWLSRQLEEAPTDPAASLPLGTLATAERVETERQI